MSDPSETPPGNRPPAGRVFRPFAGGGAQQGSAASHTVERRPMQPRRPFVGGPAATSGASAPAPLDISPVFDISPAIDVSSTIEISSVIDASPAIAVNATADVASSAPAPEIPDPPVVERATWLTIVEAEPAVLDFGTGLVGENATLGDDSGIGEPAAAPPDLPAIAEETFAPSFEERVPSPPEKLPVVTAEVLTTESEEIDLSEVPEHVDSIAEYGEPDLLDAPLFIAPSSAREADSLIDEVEAAFITAGLPSTGDPSDDALRAAAALEEIARRLRAGDIELQRNSTGSIASEESALATVLAALLANR